LSQSSCKAVVVVVSVVVGVFEVLLPPLYLVPATGAIQFT